MEHYAGVDVPLERSSVCVVEATGRIAREAKFAGEQSMLVASLDKLPVRPGWIALEAGPLSQWLDAGLSAAGHEADLLETRHVKAAFSTMLVKTDRKDAHGIAQLLRMGWFRSVHRKGLRALLVGHKLLQAKLLDVEGAIRGVLLGSGSRLARRQAAVCGTHLRAGRRTHHAGARGGANSAGPRRAAG